VVPAALITTLCLLGLLFWLGEALKPLQPYKDLYWRAYGDWLTAYVAILILNLFAFGNLVTRALGLRTAGRKLAHLDRELRSDSALSKDLKNLEEPDEDL
jgi:hypothetical protein